MIYCNNCRTCTPHTKEYTEDGMLDVIRCDDCGAENGELLD